MVMSTGTARSSIVTGCTLLALTLAAVVCGGVAMDKMYGSFWASFGLWALYFIIPGVLCILSGYKKLPSILGVALGAHILGIFIAITGMSFAAAFWSYFNLYCNFSLKVLNNEYCFCTISSRLYTANLHTCSDLETVRNATAAITIVFALLTIVSFVGSIQGCIGTCCEPREQVAAVVASQFPVQPNTVIVTSSQQQAQFMQPGLFAQRVQPYSQPLTQPAHAYHHPPPGYVPEPGAVGQEHGTVNQVMDSKN